MKNKAILFGGIGFLAGILLTVLFTVKIIHSNNLALMNMMGIYPAMTESLSHHHGMTMDDMVNDLKGKSGDEFDKIFLTGMIEHHQGAIDMAKLAQKYAVHEEIKGLADEIITAQTKEIKMMSAWQKSWNY